MNYPSSGPDLDLNLNFLSESQDSNLGEVRPCQISCKEEIMKYGGTGHKSSSGESGSLLKQFYI